MKSEPTSGHLHNGLGVFLDHGHLVELLRDGVDSYFCQWAACRQDDDAPVERMTLTVRHHHAPKTMRPQHEVRPHARVDRVEAVAHFALSIFVTVN